MCPLFLCFPIIIIPYSKYICFALSHPRYDAVVLGKGLVTSGNPCEMIQKARHRAGLPRKLLGLGLRAEDLHV